MRWVTLIGGLRFVLLFMVCMAGCAKSVEQGSIQAEPSQPLQGVDELVKVYDELIPWNELKACCNKSVIEVRKITRNAIWHGKQDVLTTIILDVMSGKLTKKLWYDTVEDVFADTWRTRDVPIQTGASQRTIAVLKAIARKGKCRNARVSAAIAIRHLDPELAKAVFLKEYGDFTLNRLPGDLHIYSGRPIPLSVGTYLQEMGIWVPCEITSLHDGKVLLTWQAREQLELSQVQAAINEYNKKIRNLLLAQETEKLEGLTRSLNKKEFLKSCFDSVTSSAMEKPKLQESNIFE